LAAVLVLPKLIAELVAAVMLALAAELEPVNCSELLLKIVAPPAEAVVLKVRVPEAVLVMLAPLAVLRS